MNKVKIRIVKRAMHGNQQAFAEIMMEQADYLVRTGHLYLKSWLTKVKRIIYWMRMQFLLVGTAKIKLLDIK